MSLILEALRKSEAERRRGHAPQLFDAPVAPAPTAPAHARSIAWWPAIPMLVLLLAFAWWRSTSSTPTAAESVEPAPDSGMATTSGAPAQSSRTDRTTPPVAPQSVPRDEQAAQSGPSQPADAMPAAARPGPRAAVSQALQADMPASAPVSTPYPAPAPRTATSPTPTPSAPKPATAAPVAMASPPAPAAAARDDGPLRLADLSTAERSALPPLRMSMHLWAPVAADRFVILDGARVAEGDRVGVAVVQEITPDGAVLDWQGRRVKVPVR